MTTDVPASRFEVPWQQLLIALAVWGSGTAPPGYAVYGYEFDGGGVPRISVPAIQGRPMIVLALGCAATDFLSKAVHTACRTAASLRHIAVASNIVTMHHHPVTIPSFGSVTTPITPSCTPSPAARPTTDTNRHLLAQPTRTGLQFDVAGLQCSGVWRPLDGPRPHQDKDQVSYGA